MTGHTPGPWELTGPNVRERESGALLFVQARPFADCDPDPEEQAANLRLVAAAPLLKTIVEGFLGTLTNNNNAYQGYLYYDANYELCKLAIDTIQELKGE
jgi:hypothetical protein